MSNLQPFAILILPSLLILLTTGLFGLADVRPLTKSFKSHSAAFDILLGAAFFILTVGATGRFLSVVSGEHHVSGWECCITWGAAGIFLLIGHYAPWRKWIKRDGT